MRSIILPILLLPLMMVACSQGDRKPDGRTKDQNPVIYVVNYPLMYFTQRIGGEYVQVYFPVPSDADPAFWLPDTRTISNYQQADLIMANGAGYARWMTKVSLPDSKIVDTSRSFRDKLVKPDDQVTHSHGPKGDHSHVGVAFTTWLDFQQAIRQARSIRDALAALEPEHQEAFETAFVKLEADLAALDKQMADAAKDIAGKPLLASHPVYQYLARRYQLKVRSVLWEPEVIPDQQAMEQLKQLNESDPAKWMIWEAKPDASTLEKLESLGIRSIVFNPCANRPAQGDFLSVMRANVKAMQQVAAPAIQPK